MNIKENWSHLAEGNSQPGAKITTIFQSYYHKNIFKMFIFFQEQNHLM